MSATAPSRISSNVFERWLISRIDIPAPGSASRSRRTSSRTGSGRTAGPAPKLKMRSVITSSFLPDAAPTAGRRSGREYRKPPEPARPIDSKVLPVEGEDSGDPLALRDAYERRVGEVHRQVAILLHERPHARQITGGQIRQNHRPVLEEFPECVLGLPREAQEMHRLRHGGPDGERRPFQGSEDLRAGFVKVVAPMNERHEGPRIDQNQRERALLRRICRTFAPVFTERSGRPPDTQPIRCAERSYGVLSSCPGPSSFSAASKIACRITSDFVRPCSRPSLSTSFSVFRSNRTLVGIAPPVVQECTTRVQIGSSVTSRMSEVLFSMSRSTSAEGAWFKWIRATAAFAPSKTTFSVSCTLMPACLIRSKTAASTPTRSQWRTTSR